MKYSRTEIKKTYESPNLKIHKLMMESSILQVVGSVPHVPWDDSPKQQRVFDDERYVEGTYQEDFKCDTYGQF